MMKGLILCAGRGTRLQPLSFTQPKTFLPVANKPVLLHCIEKLVEIGIVEIGIVINKKHESLFKQKLGASKEIGAKITYIYQLEQKGIADAVKHAESFIDNDSFLLLLGDSLISDSLEGLKNTMADEDLSCSIMLSRVEKPEDYGIATIRGNKIVELEEKPKNPKSNLAIIGAYAFTPEIFHAIHSISPSARGEYEMTDAIQRLINHGAKISYTITDQPYSDVGTVDRWLKANQWMLDKITKNNVIISKKSSCINCKFIPPVIIGDDCKLNNSTIGPYVSITSGVIIENCHIENSILLDKTKLEKLPQTVKDSVFGQFTEVKGFAGGGHSKFILGEKSVVDLKREEDQE